MYGFILIRTYIVARTLGECKYGTECLCFVVFSENLQGDTPVHDKLIDEDQRCATKLGN